MSISEIKMQAKKNIKLCWGNQLAIAVYSALAISFPIINFIFGGSLAICCADAYYRISKGEKVEVNFLLNGFKKNIGHGLLALVLCEIAIIVGTLLLIVPGIIMACMYSMTFYIMAREPELDGNEAMKKSKELMKGHKMKWFLMGLSFIGWYILCILTFGLLLVYVGPYVINAGTLFFNEIYEAAGYTSKAEPVRQEDPKVEPARPVVKEEPKIEPVKPVPTTKSCNNCGATIPAASQFCPYCGGKA